jgi:biopolymer transport protein ExbD
MIDVVFQLVVFFMVSSTFIVTPGINLTLPDSSTAEPVVMSKLVVTVAGEDEVYLNKDRYTMEELGSALAEVQRESDESTRHTVVVEADRSVSYSVMVEVLDNLRMNGFDGVNLRMREGAQ